MGVRNYLLILVTSILLKVELVDSRAKLNFNYKNYGDFGNKQEQLIDLE